MEAPNCFAHQSTCTHHISNWIEVKVRELLYFNFSMNVNETIKLQFELSFQFKFAQVTLDSPRISVHEKHLKYNTLN